MRFNFALDHGTRSKVREQVHERFPDGRFQIVCNGSQMRVVADDTVGLEEALVKAITQYAPNPLSTHDLNEIDSMERCVGRKSRTLYFNVTLDKTAIKQMSDRFRDHRIQIVSGLRGMRVWVHPCEDDQLDGEIQKFVEENKPLVKTITHFGSVADRRAKQRKREKNKNYE